MQTVTLTGHYKDINTLSAEGYVLISPVTVDPVTDEVTTVKRIVDSVGNVVFHGKPVKVPLSWGKFSVVLPATDDATLNPTGFGYQVVARFPRDLPPTPVVFSLPASPATVDIADVTPAEPGVVYMPPSGGGPHGHPVAEISDFTEQVQDAVAAMLVSGGDVTLTYNDVAGTLQVTSAGGGDAETIRDTIGAAMVGINGVVIAVNDGADTITLSITGLTIAQTTGLQAALDAKASAAGMPVRMLWNGTTGWVDPRNGNLVNQASGRPAMNGAFIELMGHPSSQAEPTWAILGDTGLVTS